jgi:hypothetical protein
MGEGSERVAASGDSKNNQRGSSEAHNVSSSSKEDRGVPAGKMGEVEGGTEERRVERASTVDFVELEVAGPRAH